MTTQKIVFANLAAVAALAAAGCGHGRMLPAESANMVPGAPNFAASEVDGVRIAAGGEWEGRPKNLSDHLTPLKVRIINRSGKAVRVLYEDFVLAGARGRKYRPLPVVPIEHSARERLRPSFAAQKFFVGPRYRDVYPSLPAWERQIPRDEEFYQRQYDRWSSDLPTREMKRMALPEGVLADGGQITGFVFFEDAASRESKVTFRADLAGDEDGETVASIEIPFQIN
jgi:hypothetical protein